MMSNQYNFSEICTIKAAIEESKKTFLSFNDKCYDSEIEEHEEIINKCDAYINDYLNAAKAMDFLVNCEHNLEKVGK